MDSKAPLISFVIPVYKKPVEVFEKCLHSLFDMSHKNIEVICVFDGPDADLEKVANGYKVQKIVIEHGGAPKARNAGFEHTKGRYVSFWDADCYAKPEMARMWVETFDLNPDAAFVYSGYEWEGGGFPSQPFDSYLLQCGNLVATMFPMKREVFPGFDENLKAAQDWDMWLTIVENGGKGVWIEGYGFVTEPPTDPNSISGQNWNNEKYWQTLNTVKEKHGIPIRDIVVTASSEKIKGLHLAKILDADFVQLVCGRPHHYKMILNLGFGPDIRFENAPKDAVRIQYWLPWDINGLESIPYKSAIKTIRNALNEVPIHLCNEVVSKKRLADLGIVPGNGIPAEIVPLPTECVDLETKLPEKYRVLMEIADIYKPIFKSIKEDLPYIQIDELDHATNPVGNITDYSLFVSFSTNPTIDEGIRRFLLNGRNVISNVQAPYCGFTDLEVGFGEFKDNMIKAIRDARYLKFNQAAQDYYSKIVDPGKFKAKIMSFYKAPAKLEVLA
jgi:glycosyltransferase involved in cell wall biosynthesis